VQAVKKQDLIGLAMDRLCTNSSTHLKGVGGLLYSVAGEKRPQLAIQKLDVECLWCLVVAVVDPIGRMLDQRPEVIIEVEHEET